MTDLATAPKSVASDRIALERQGQGLGPQVTDSAVLARIATIVGRKTEGKK